MADRAHVRFFLQKCRALAVVTVKNVGTITLSNPKVTLPDGDRQVYNTKFRTVKIPGTKFSVVIVIMKYMNGKGHQGDDQPAAVHALDIGAAGLEITITNDPPAPDPLQVITISGEEPNPQSEPGDDPT